MRSCQFWSLWRLFLAFGFSFTPSHLVAESSVLTNRAYQFGNWVHSQLPSRKSVISSAKAIAPMIPLAPQISEAGQHLLEVGTRNSSYLQALTGNEILNREPLWLPRFDSQGKWDEFCPNGKEGLDQILIGLSIEYRIPAKYFVRSIRTGSFPRTAQKQFAKLGLTPSPPERNEQIRAKLGLQEGYDIPLGITVTGENKTKIDGGDPLNNKFVVFNCLTCHSRMQNNRVIIGGANQWVNSGAFRVQGEASAPLMRLALNSSFLSKAGPHLTEYEKKLLAENLEYFEKFAIPSTAKVPSATRRGNNFGFNIDWFQLASLKENPRFPFELDYGVEQNPIYTELKHKTVPPVQAFPWFIHSAKENYGNFPSTYRYGEPRNFPHPTNFSVIPRVRDGASKEEIAQASDHWNDHSERISRIWKLFSCLPVPEYPGVFDEKKAISGCKKFNENACARCHGKFTFDSGTQKWQVSDYTPGKLVNIGTDPEYSSYVSFNINRHKAKSSTENSPIAAFNLEAGEYTPPPLVGLWARAPYLHNGSVPTVYDLITPPDSTEGLGPSRRSDVKYGEKYYFLEDPNQFDDQRLGVRWREISRKSYLEGKKYQGGDGSRYFSTGEFGMNDRGHPFYIESFQDRMEIIECFKLLSGKNVR